MVRNDKRKLYEALTRKNYFPNQKETIGELPPCLDTRQFTPEVCEALAALPDSRIRRKSGYDLVEYKATRYNNVPRILSLVHPKAYAFLAKHIHDNWANIKKIQESKHSQIKPEHRNDGRIMVMNYESPIIQKRRYNQASFSKKFLVKADIANCFNSIYTHAIPWAIVGITDAKQNDSNELWYNKLDLFQRKAKRGETQGIPIGPATSSFIVELILQEVDQKLISNSFYFERYVDDYLFYCDSYEQAQSVIIILGRELAAFKLTLNLNKTIITELPSANEDGWILELLGSLPNRFHNSEGNEQKFSAAEAMTFINRAVVINKATPDGSVLKYAIQLIVPHIDELSSNDLLSVVLNLSWHYPILIPYISQLIDKHKIDPYFYEYQLNQIIIENAKQHRSDGMAWPLYILKQNEITPSKEAIQAVMDSKDCVSITILHSILDDKQCILDFAQKILGDNYQMDSYWLLLYQLYFFNDLQNNPYDDEVFVVLKNYRVNFIPDEQQTEAELEANRITVATIFDTILSSDVNPAETL